MEWDVINFEVLEDKSVRVHKEAAFLNETRVMDYILYPGQDISNESQEIQDACNAEWTQEVIDTYQMYSE